MKFQSEADRIRYEKDYLPAYNALMKWYPFTLADHADEIWQPVAGYEEFYHISTYGRVKSFKQRRAGKILKPQLTDKGYLYVGLHMNGETKNFFVHVLVARAFIPNPDNKPEVNHVFGNKLDNFVDNLEWNTSAENQQHAFATGLQVAKKGTENGRAKIQDEETIIYIRNNPDGLTGRQLADMFGVDETLISNIQTGKLWGHVGGTIRKSKCPRVSEETKRLIRADYATGQYSQRQLARKYGVDPKTIWRIINEV